MNFNIDIAIVAGFLILTLVVGLGHGQKVKTIKDYALGGRNFSTSALVATIVATWASGSGFFVTLSKTYSDGFYYMFASSGMGISFFILSLWLIPRMGEFLGKTSIAEALGDLYGDKVRFITAISGTIGAAGSIAVQFKVFGGIFSYFLSIPGNLAIIAAGIIATVYSAFGGIRAVTFTDILQFFAFGFVIPLVGFLIWGTFFNEGLTISSAMSDPKFNLVEIFSIGNPKLLGLIVMLIYFTIPSFSAPAFQRIAIGSSIKQVKKAFLIAGIFLILIKLLIAWIPFLLYSINPTLKNDSLLGYIIDTFSYTGLKGLIIVAIIAFAMSTADSRINSASVLFTNDIYHYLKHDIKNEIFISRLFAFLLGAGSIMLSLYEADILGIIVLANSFYYPVVTPLFLLTIFGFRSSGKSVLIGMLGALTITILWKFLPIKFNYLPKDMVGVLAAMLCNVVFLMGSHYLLRQPGGWVGIKDQTYLEEQVNKKSWQRLVADWFNNVSLVGYCRKIAPSNDITYTMFGVYFIAFTFTTMYSTQVELLEENSRLTLTIYQIMIVTGTVIAMYPLWPLSIASLIKESIIRAWWPLAIFYMLIFFSCFFIMVSKFAMLQVALFCINIIIASLLLGWRMALPLIILGFYLSIQFYRYFFKDSGFEVQFGSPEFILIYIVVLWIRQQVLSSPILSSPALSSEQRCMRLLGIR
jgi:Na+/proline symporter